jgi:metallo-beta-lactamase family protein
MNKAGKGNRKRGKGKFNSGSGQQPLYLQKHVMDTVERFVTIGFNRPFRLMAISNLLLSRLATC